MAEIIRPICVLIIIVRSPDLTIHRYPIWFSSNIVKHKQENFAKTFVEFTPSLGWIPSQSLGIKSTDDFSVHEDSYS